MRGQLIEHLDYLAQAVKALLVAQRRARGQTLADADHGAGQGFAAARTYVEAVDAQGFRHLRLQVHGLGLTQQGACRHLQQDELLLAAAFQAVPQHQPGELLRVGHGRIGIERHQRTLHCAAHLYAHFHVRCLAYRQHVEPGIVDGSGKTQDAALDVQRLRIGGVAPFLHLDRPLAAQGLIHGEHTQLTTQPRIEPGALEEEIVTQLERQVERQRETLGHRFFARRPAEDDDIARQFGTARLGHFQTGPVGGEFAGELQAFLVEVEPGRAGYCHVAVAAVGRHKFLEREREPGLRVFQLGVAAHHDAAAGAFQHALLYQDPVVRQLELERAVGDRHALLRHGETDGVGGNPAVDARCRQAAAAAQLRIDARIGADANRNERLQQSQVRHVELGIPRQRRAARQGECGLRADQHAPAIQTQLSCLVRVGGEPKMGLAAGRIDIEREGGQPHGQRRIGQPHIAGLATQLQPAIERLARAQVPVAVHAQVGGERRRRLQQREHGGQRQIGKRAAAGQMRALAIEAFDRQPAACHGQRQIVHLLSFARQQQVGGGHQFHWPVAQHLGLIQLPAPYPIRIQSPRQARRRAPRGRAGIERQRVRLAAPLQRRPNGVQVLPGQLHSARVELPVEHAAGGSLHVHAQIHGLGGDVAGQVQAAGGELRVDLQAGRIAAGAAATGQPPGQTQVQARQRRRIDVPDEPVARPAVRAFQLCPVAGQIQIDVGVDEMPVFITQPPLSAHRTAFKVARRQVELCLHARHGQQGAAGLAARVEPSARKLAETGRIDLRGIERSAEGTRGVEMERALCRQAPRLSGKTHRLQTQYRASVRQRKAALPPAFADIGRKRLARRITLQLQGRPQARGNQLAMQPGEIEAWTVQIHAQAAVAPLSAPVQLSGRTQIDRQCTEIGPHAVAHHRAGQIGERQAVLVEPPGQPVAEAEAAQQALARLAFEHAGKRQVGARRARGEQMRVDTLPGHQQPGQAHAREGRGFAAGHHGHASGLGIEAEDDGCQPPLHVERGAGRDGVAARGVEPPLQLERRVLVEFEPAADVRPGRGGRHAGEPIAVAVVVDASVQVLEVECAPAIDDSEMRHIPGGHVHVDRQAQAGGQRWRRRVRLQGLDPYGLRRQQADVEPPPQQRARLPFQPDLFECDALRIRRENEFRDVDGNADMSVHALDGQSPAAQENHRLAQPAESRVRRRHSDHHGDQQNQRCQQGGQSSQHALQNDTPSEKCRRN